MRKLCGSALWVHGCRAHVGNGRGSVWLEPNADRARQGADEVKEKKAGPGPWGPYKPEEGSTFTQGQGEVWEGGGNRE